MLICSVRDCRLPLVREGKARLTCARGHSFDVARSGYVNLLQPQDRRSSHPGDTAAAVQGRRRLHDTGSTKPLLEGIAEMLGATRSDFVLDAGCGEGFYLGNLALQTGCSGHGVDISVAAVDAAAKRYPDCQWIVANADRFLPFGNRSFSMLMSITARMNPAEFLRVLRPGGRLLVALPSPEDLIELRGKGREDRLSRTIGTFADGFSLEAQRRVSTAAELDAATIEDLRHTIYRPLQAEPAQAMRVTFSLDLLLFRSDL